MLVYIEVASAEKNKAFSGLVSSLSSLMTVVESFTNDYTSIKSSFSL
jgi:hypothetical protein